MDSATRVIIISGMVIFLIGFMILVIAVVSALKRLKYIFIQIEKMSAEVTDLAIKIKSVIAHIENKPGAAGNVSLSGTAIKAIGSIASLATGGMLAKAGGVMALLPVIKSGWRFMKNIISRK